MFLRELSVSVETLHGAGPASVHALAKAGILGVGNLLCRYPRDYEDRSRPVPLKDFNRAPVCTTVKILAHEWFGFGRMRTLKVHVEDRSARAVLVCFNRPFLEKQLVQGESYRLWGKFYYKYGFIQSTAFEIGNADQGGKVQFDGIIPVYSLPGGLKQGLLRRLIRQALDRYAPSLEDELPDGIISRDGLLSKGEALRAIHFPSSQEELQRARKTLIYEELFYLEIMVGRRALERRNPDRSRESRPSVPAFQGAFSPLQRRLVERLPFALTAGQREAVEEINRDMDGLDPSGSPGTGVPMARLLQGDVGSGKTLTAFLACLRAVDQGGQAALLAPTELLARQHADNAARLLEPLGLRIAYLTGNLKAAGRSLLLKNLAAGDIDLAAGTHALFSRDAAYRNLRLVVIDEQHRFGVTQRQAIMVKGDRPDLLMMSATPIPRSLAMTVFGDLDVSVIRDMPPGRKPVKTHLARESSEARVYDFVRRELAVGRQAYFVYPLIEAAESESPRAELKDAESMAQRLSREVFPGYPLALIHSRLGDDEKRETMEAFRRGDIRVLAATSVVEVGVDVPNATCMVIEHAERFGLSALHQLRGRVGRGEGQSYCFLVYSDEGPDGLGQDAKTRLMVMRENSDGFVIAEEDLKLRGPGQIAGIEQSGYLALSIADPVRDAAELARAREDAFALLEKDSNLSLPEQRRIAEILERAPPFGDIHF
jgi:ATP-dependent DNA helicase RecG